METALIDAGPGQAMIRVRAKSAGPGLIAHRHRFKGWQLSHRITGRPLLPSLTWRTQSQAIAAGKSIANLIDWNRDDPVEAAREAELTDADVRRIVLATKGCHPLRP